MEEVQRGHPFASVEVWAEDEHRVGLKPILRRRCEASSGNGLAKARNVWTPKGVRPVAKVRPRYEWVWVYGFVHPDTGKTEWLLMPYVDTGSYGAALREFARAAGVGPEKQVVLAVDQAGWHRAKDLEIPEGLHLVFLPAYCPELQPAERLWPLCDEGLANKLFATIGDLERAVADRLVTIKDEAVRRLTSYYWWPKSPKDALVFSRS